MLRRQPPSPPPPSTVDRDPYYRDVPPLPILIRITGGKRTYDSTYGLTTLYSWQQVFHPNDTQPSENPQEINPAVHQGPKTSGGPDNENDWAAIEASGSATVPTDGSVVVLAHVSPTQDRLVFSYPGRLIGRITAKYEANNTTYYGWTESEPSFEVAEGRDWENAPTASALTGGPAHNPAFELNKRTDVPIGTLVEIKRYPSRGDPSSFDGYFFDRPQAEITTDVVGDGATTRTKYAVAFTGARLYGTFRVVVMSTNGVPHTTTAIGHTASEETIESAITVASTAAGFGSVTVEGNATDGFTVEFSNTFDFVPPIWIDDRALFGGIPYYFEYWGFGETDQSGSGSGYGSDGDDSLVITDTFQFLSPCPVRIGDELVHPVKSVTVRSTAAGVKFYITDATPCPPINLCCDGDQQSGSGSSGGGSGSSGGVSFYPCQCPGEVYSTSWYTDLTGLFESDDANIQNGFDTDYARGNNPSKCEITAETWGQSNQIPPNDPDTCPARVTVGPNPDGSNSWLVSLYIGDPVDTPPGYTPTDPAWAYDDLTTFTLIAQYKLDNPSCTGPWVYSLWTQNVNPADYFTTWPATVTVSTL